MLNLTPQIKIQYTFKRTLIGKTYKPSIDKQQSTTARKNQVTYQPLFVLLKRYIATFSHHSRNKLYYLG